MTNREYVQQKRFELLTNKWWENNSILEDVLYCFEISLEEFRNSFIYHNAFYEVPIEEYFKFSDMIRPTAEVKGNESDISELGGPELITFAKQFNENIRDNDLTESNMILAVKIFGNKLHEALTNLLSWIGMISVKTADSVYIELYDIVSRLTDSQSIFKFIHNNI